MMQWQAGECPGNVHELRNFAGRLVLGINGTGICQRAEAAASPQSLSQQVDDFEKMLILHAMKGCDGSVSAAADALLMPEKTLYDKLKKHCLRNSRAFGEG